MTDKERFGKSFPSQGICNQTGGCYWVYPSRCFACRRLGSFEEEEMAAIFSAY
jgi:hypothetical protein